MTLAISSVLSVQLLPSVGAAPTILPVPLIFQTQLQWCWAACIEMILSYDRKPTVSQCELANQAFGQTSCCSTPSSRVCNQPLLVPSVGSEWTRHGYQSAYAASALQWPQTNNNIVNRRPVEIGLAWTNGGGHAVLIVGTDTINGTEWVTVNDSNEGQKNITQIELETAYGEGAWRWSWDDIH